MNPEPRDPADLSAAPVCYRHTDRVTHLSCSQCGRSICPDCSYDAAVGQRCPECVARAGTTRVIRARQTRSSSPVVTGIIALTILVFFVQRGSASFQLDFAQINEFVRAGEYWRLVTAAFLHGSVMHIAFNMYALYLFGPSLERRFGSLPFVMLYIASALAGGAAFLYFGGDNAAVGASGAIFGLFGAWIGASYRMRNTPAGAAQFRNLAVLLLINLALPFLAPGLNIAWQAHVGGLLAGVAVISAWLYLAPVPKDDVKRTLLAAAVAAISLVLALLA